MSERIKQHFRLELINLKELVQIPPRETMLLHVAVYKMLRGITDYTDEVMEGVPAEFGRPMAEMLMNNYYEKYEQERLEKAAEAQAKFCEDPEAAEAEVSSSPLTIYVALSIFFYVPLGCRSCYFVKEDDFIQHGLTFQKHYNFSKLMLPLNFFLLDVRAQVQVKSSIYG